MPSLGQYQGLALQQTLSPQMQQSLHILQAPLLELRSMINKELEQNPAIEEAPPPESTKSEQSGSEATAQPSIGEFSEPYYAQTSRSDILAAQERRDFFFNSLTRPTSLAESALAQMGLMDLSPAQARIAAAIAGNLDPRGYLAVPVEDIAAAEGVPATAVERVLEWVGNHLDPPGLAARDLRECLLLQLRREGRGGGLEEQIVTGHLENLARKRHDIIARSLGVSTTEARAAAEKIASLDPAPGRAFDSEPDQILIPEVLVEIVEDGFAVRLNRSELPALRISDSCKDLLASANGNDPQLRPYLRGKIRDGRFLIRSIEQRNETILSIAREIVLRQEDFMRAGPTHLKPMTMGEVADSVGVHETTVSRAVAGKYMDTPQGIFEMRYFFTSGYRTESGDSVSNESVRREIAALVQGENSAKPLSDEKLAQLLKEIGIPVARRTVAKYREQLGILPSHLRKR